jgi:hypothetical protein
MTSGLRGFYNPLLCAFVLGTEPDVALDFVILCVTHFLYSERY